MSVLAELTYSLSMNPRILNFKTDTSEKIHQTDYLSLNKQIKILFE